jgi:glutathione S-transferase
MMENAMSTLSLISHHLCPYVQRVAITLAEKQIEVDRLYIDLAAKPAWFNAISPLGKVPVLRIDDTALFESAVICDYLEEVYPAHPMHPEDPLQRAKHRGWIEFASAILGDIWGFETARDEITAHNKAQQLRMKFQQLDTALGEGPFFAGPSFTLVDAAFAPVFRYFDLFDQIADFGIFAELHRLHTWRSVLAARPSVRRAVTDDYQQRLRAFLERNQAYLHHLATSRQSQAS